MNLQVNHFGLEHGGGRETLGVEEAEGGRKVVDEF